MVNINVYSAIHVGDTKKTIVKYAIPRRLLQEIFQCPTQIKSSQYDHMERDAIFVKIKLKEWIPMLYIPLFACYKINRK